MMKVEIAKSDLEDALSVSRVTVASNSGDLSSHFVFRSRNGNLEVLSYHGRTFSMVPLKCSHDAKDGETFTLEAWRLDKWLSGIGDVVVVMDSTNTGEVKISGGRSTIRLRSLDPSRFPYWDGTYASAHVKGSVPASRLANALSFSRLFVSAEDTTRPEIAQVEFMNGSLWSSDRRAASIVRISNLEDSTLRISGKDLGAVIKFLGSKPTNELDIQIKESDTALFLSRPDGAHIGCSRPNVSFPNVKLDERDAPTWIQFPAAEFNSAINILSASSSKGNGRMTFNLDGTKLILSMPSEAGGSDSYPIDLTGHEGLEEFPDSGFEFDYIYIQKLISQFSLDTVDLEVMSAQGNRGCVGFRRQVKEADGNTDTNFYLVLIQWRI
jgi:DNA polymerase III sliding clamp (beta) subunit (PCNA family)